MTKGTRKQRRGRHGFTLMEVLLVLAILVILGGMVGVYFSGIQTGSYQDAARIQMGHFEKALELYRLNVGTYPSTDQGLDALLVAPMNLADPTRWRGPYLKEELPLDPWGNDYIYELVSGEQFQIMSFGPDMTEGTEDDVYSNEI